MNGPDDSNYLGMLSGLKQSSNVICDIFDTLSQLVLDCEPRDLEHLGKLPSVGNILRYCSYCFDVELYALSILVFSTHMLS